MIFDLNTKYSKVCCIKTFVSILIKPCINVNFYILDKPAFVQLYKLDDQYINHQVVITLVKPKGTTSMHKFYT